jgi:hypothetical protein
MISPFVGATIANFQWENKDRGRSTLSGSALFDPDSGNATKGHGVLSSITGLDPR